MLSVKLLRQYGTCFDLNGGLFEFRNPTVILLGRFPSLPMENARTKFRCTEDRNFGRVSFKQLWQPDRASSSYIAFELISCILLLYG